MIPKKETNKQMEEGKDPCLYGNLVYNRVLLSETRYNTESITLGKLVNSMGEKKIGSVLCRRNKNKLQI